MDVAGLLREFHRERHCWSRFYGMDDVPAEQPVLVRFDVADFLREEGESGGWSPLNIDRAGRQLLFFHPVIEAGMDHEFYFLPWMQRGGPILFHGGLGSRSRVVHLEEHPDVIGVGNWRGVELYRLERCGSPGGGSFMMYIRRES